ncbi:uncharacterized protein BDZ99DRAFT_86313 [Mytilinidion resinicola]|uniref:Uncharacterized protein n=1 Tax=Mytilinidion resinicola TaxID=574789 RepID=A0A6A6YG22_9PEZI|nr:uncharacterized protein BDZ99DRAFT_86313 [Mytilinidion resinicola]KAF2806837.1 hypothetical protein BDZ99DRAFT_86313 [Mytilinidion resinicola]
MRARCESQRVPIVATTRGGPRRRRNIGRVAVERGVRMHIDSNSSSLLEVCLWLPFLASFWPILRNQDVPLSRFCLPPCCFQHHAEKLRLAVFSAHHLINPAMSNSASTK